MSAIRQFTSVELSTSSLLSRSLGHDAGMHCAEGPFHFLDGAIGDSDEL